MFSKKGFEFNFAWLFSIFVGIIIIFLAIYGSTKLIKTEQYKVDTVTANQLSILFEPLETGLATGKSQIIELKDEVEINNECVPEGKFGKNRISIGSGGPISIENKYIFSEDTEKGDTIFVISKSFEMPWKISELIILTTKNYCFLDAGPDIRKDMGSLNLQNINLDECEEGDIEVCFDSGNCEIEVDYDENFEYGYVEKDNEKLEVFGEALLYSAIFSSPEIYGNNIERLMKRLSYQAELFLGQSKFISIKYGCGVVSPSDLEFFKEKATDVYEEGLDNLYLVNRQADELNVKNDEAQCDLW